MKCRRIKGTLALDVWFATAAMLAGVDAVAMLTMPATEVLARIRRRCAS